MPDKLAADRAWVRWLCGDDADRARFRATMHRFRRSYLFGLAVGGSCSIAASWYGWSLLLLVLLASLTMGVGVRVATRARRVELPAVATFLLLELNLAASVLLSGGGRSPLLPLLAVPVFTQAVLFRPPVLMAAVGVSATSGVAAVALARHVRDVADAPTWIHAVCYLGLLAALSLAAWWLAAADRSSRGDAVLDPLTGLLNRGALATRFELARQQARGRRSAVSVIVCDVDHFKAVNDTYGHERGDEVLQSLAEILRRTSATSDDAYRIGGEEFLVLLPGHELAGAAEVAERLRVAVEAAPVAGLPLTISVGVACASGADVVLPTLMAAADRALYSAKRAGRNRVSAGSLPAAREVPDVESAPASGTPAAT